MGKRQLNFAYALKSFTGYLEGTGKSAHTIRNYRLDLLAFGRFLEEEARDRRVELAQIDENDLEHYHSQMKAQGLKTNTRRRRLMTIRRFLGYLVKRNKLPVELGKKLPTPHKIERVPFTVPSEQLLGSIRALKVETVIDLRNQVLLWTLAETGCQVSEVARLRASDFVRKGAHTVALEIPGKAARAVPVSMELYERIEELKSRSAGTRKPSEHLFLGFNKSGPLGTAITPRGVELLVKAHGLRTGIPNLTPRTFRHSLVLSWFAHGLPQEEIQRRLGLKTAYAFRTFEPLLQALRSGETDGARRKATGADPVVRP